MRGSYRLFLWYVFTCFYFFLNGEFIIRVLWPNCCPCPKKSSNYYQYLWYYFLFPPDFQFWDLWKINKENESIKWEWWIIHHSHLMLSFSLFIFQRSQKKKQDRNLRSCFFFSPLLSCFSGTLLALFSLCKNKIKNGSLHADYVTWKLKWKSVIRD